MANRQLGQVVILPGNATTDEILMRILADLRQMHVEGEKFWLYSAILCTNFPHSAKNYFALDSYERRTRWLRKHTKRCAVYAREYVFPEGMVPPDQREVETFVKEAGITGERRIRDHVELLMLDRVTYEFWAHIDTYQLQREWLKHAMKNFRKFHRRPKEDEDA